MEWNVIDLFESEEEEGVVRVNLGEIDLLCKNLFFLKFLDVI